MNRARAYSVLFLSLLIVTLLISLHGGFVLAQGNITSTPTPPGNYVLGDDVFLRGGPGRDYAPVGQVIRGMQVLPLARNSAASWVMIAYGRGYGWLRSDLVNWADNITSLPVLSLDNLTPSPRASDPTVVPVFPTNTPEGNWANVNALGAYLRAGPGRTYLVMGALHAGDVVTPVARTEDTSWVMIRYDEGFAWVRWDLVRWQDDLAELPVMSTEEPDGLTPTLTFTPSATASWTPTSTGTITPSYTPTVTTTPSLTATFTPSSTATNTPTATATASPTATDTPTLTSTATTTATVTPSVTNTPSSTPTDTPTATATNTPTSTATLTATATATATATDTATSTATVTPVPTDLPTDVPTELPTDAPTELPTDAPTELPTDVPTELPTDAPTATTAVEPTVDETRVAALAIPATFTPMPSPQRADETLTPSPSPTVPPTLTPQPPTATAVPPATVVPAATSAPGIAGLTALLPEDISQDTLLLGGGLALLLIYLVLVLAGAINAYRYRGGFVLQTCPVCQQGELSVVNRRRHLLGIPRVRRTVHCDYCGSVLRQVRPNRWRYTVDGRENEKLFRKYNGREITDAELSELGTSTRMRMVRMTPPTEPPTYVDDDSLER